MDKPQIMTVPNDLWLSLAMVSVEAVEIITALLKEEGERLQTDLDALLYDADPAEPAPPEMLVIYDRLGAIQEMNQLLPKLHGFATVQRDEADEYWAEQPPVYIEEPVRLQRIPFTSVYEEVRP